jgi:hypothetical protein
MPRSVGGPSLGKTEPMSLTDAALAAELAKDASVLLVARLDQGHALDQEPGTRRRSAACAYELTRIGANCTGAWPRRAGRYGSAIGTRS